MYKSRKKDYLQTKIKTSVKYEALHPDAIKILEHAKIEGRITTGEAVKITGSPRPTIKKRLLELSNSDLLKSKGQGRGSYYVPTS